MMATDLKSGWTRAAGASIGLGALLFTVACGTSDVGTVAAQSLSANQAGVPVVVACEPHQRTLVRPVVVNGAAVSQVECVAASQVAGAPAVAAAGAPAIDAPYQPYQQVRATQPVYDDANARVVYPAARTARATQARQVVYREPVKQGRSVKKSAIIIGSSAGVGAGVGAAVGGKKGALIGAAIGGGGAAIWDQITRRK
jgi:hypothetical protein